MPTQPRVPKTGVLAVVLIALLAGCAPTIGPSPTATPAPSNSSSTSPRPVFVDHGRQQYATGSARLINGVYRYVVAAGDTATGIATRFGTTTDAVATASRGGQEIFQGDVLRITQ